MKLYGKKFIKNRMDRRISDRKETMDCIIYDIVPAQRYAIVKIQGSDNPVRARYPENWEKTPVWLKKGNAAKINMTSGNKNKIELVGHGFYIPTGETAFPPEIGGLPDAIISGLSVQATDPPSMAVNVSGGSFRYDQEVYYLSGLKMDNPSFIMGSIGATEYMGTSNTVVKLAAAHASQYRIDKIVIGIDGVIHVVQGAYYGSNPIPPATPATHFLLSTVIVPPAITGIQQDLIGKNYNTPVVTHIDITGKGNYYQIANKMAIQEVTSGTPDYCYYDTKLYLTIKILDQYRQPLSGLHNLRLYIDVGHIAFDNGTRTMDYLLNGHTVTITVNRSIPTAWGEAIYDPLVLFQNDPKCTIHGMITVTYLNNESLAVPYVLDIEQCNPVLYTPPTGYIVPRT